MTDTTVANSELTEAQLALLHVIGAHTISHSRRTLLDHLHGTYNLLCDWGNEPAVCLAGLFHSIYGTYIFSSHCVELERRDEIRERLGPQAEYLAYLFCIADRRTFFTPTIDPDMTPASTPGIDSPRPLRHAENGAPVTVSGNIRSQLLEIEAANLVAQLPYRSARKRRLMTWYQPAFADNSALISAPARAALAASFAACFDSNTND